ncbi:hypothetical protein DM01DRAFT_1339906 [Hesseltinella vesiculosa]|uniref:Uncharacterized protein n=1 Tax=Hesseltinella vesiculosa TaxID=101127 RepID=A0A1X2G5L2_9FUNG|nr:hypothetical protein DM01DRAFT_1339906 [Hesseltinella vesiculosa]
MLSPSTPSPPLTSPTNNNKNDITRRQRPSTRRLVWGHARSLAWTFCRFLFKDNNWTLLLNIIGHFLAVRELWGHSRRAVQRYTNLAHTSSSVANNAIARSSSVTLLADAYRAQGVLHMALGMLAALTMRERRLSTERTALWVLALSAWGQTLVQTQAYLQSPALYTLRALQHFGSINSILTLVTTIALRNTIRRTGRWC